MHPFSVLASWVLSAVVYRLQNLIDNTLDLSIAFDVV